MAASMVHFAVGLHNHTRVSADKSSRRGDPFEMTGGI